MITSLFIGIALGSIYAWSAHTQHRNLIFAGTRTSSPFLIIVNLIRIGAVSAILAGVVFVVGPELSLLYGLVAGYICAISYLCRR